MSSMSISLNSSILNWLKLAHNLYALFHAHTIQKLSLIRSAMLIQMLCKNELDLTCSSLRTHLERFQIYLLTLKHLFSSRCCCSNLGTFSSWYSRLNMHAHSLYYWYISCPTCFKMHSRFKFSTVSIYSYEYMSLCLISLKTSSPL